VKQLLHGLVADHLIRIKYKPLNWPDIPLLYNVVEVPGFHLLVSSKHL